MDISLINTQANNQTKTDFAQTRSTAAAVAPKSDVETAPVKIAAVEKPEVKMSDDKRYEVVKRAAKSYFKDVYAVSDTSFTMFRDTSGQIITRFRNLRDGSVTYIPEPEILQYMAARGQERQALVEIDA